MIEQVMYFVLGLLTAALITIAILPALWRRAVRLTRARLEATMPLTPGEIAAAKDQLRAQFAVDLRRAESRIEAAEATVQGAKVDLGKKLATIQELQDVVASRDGRIAALVSDLGEAHLNIGSLENTADTLTRERDNLVATLNASRLSNQALDQEANALRQLSDQRQARVGELEIQVESLSARLGDSVGVASSLREELLRKSDELRDAARAAREIVADKASLDRRMAAAEVEKQERLAALETLQAERLRLIDEVGKAERERDFERVEKNGLASTLEALHRRVTELEESLTATRAANQQTVQDLTQSIEQARTERNKADDEISSLRFAKARLETDLARLKHAASAASVPALSQAVEAASGKTRARKAPAPAPKTASAEPAPAEASPDQPRPT